MSKIGKKLIAIPSGVSVTQEASPAGEAGGVLAIRGKNGTIRVPMLSGITTETDGTTIRCAAADDALQTRANWGTTRALIQNAVNGVSLGYSKTLEIEGIGFRVTAASPRELTFQLGFTHPIQFTLPDGVSATIAEGNITVSGADRHLVGQAAAHIRALKKPEPYKGKGIRYAGEVIRRKEGKKAA
ncbi:MAG: 50S ribosomal protein L6 [Candidatus Liptonbacteria bacterium]|nr:50S ribosomal protein L6 [Candidatus Liptonbacteria bacterium]